MTIGTRHRYRSFAFTEDAGAVLLLPEGAALIELSDGAQGRIRDYCARHVRSWARYMRAGAREEIMFEPVQDLLVITGVVMSSTWASGAYEKEPPPLPEDVHPWTRFTAHCHKTRPDPRLTDVAWPVLDTYGPYPRDHCMFVLESRCKIRQRLADVRLPRLELNVFEPKIDLATGGWESNVRYF